MFKNPLFLLFLLPVLFCLWSANVHSQVGIDVAKKEKLSEADKEVLKDSVMTDRFVATEPAFQIDQPLEDQLFSLDSLLSIAVGNYPNLEIQQKIIEREIANFKHERIQWTRNIYGTGFYFQGNQNALITSTVDANASTSLSNGARYGLTVQVPLYEFVGRKRKNKIAKLNYETEELKIEQLIREIKQQVTQAYAMLISSQKLFLIASDGVQSSAINVENAQLEFEQGIIVLSELSRIMEINLRMRVDYENARANFFNAFHQFEIIVGIPIEELVKAQ